MSPNKDDRELKKFREVSPTSDLTKVAVEVENDLPIKVETAGVDWDRIETTYPTSNQDLFTYKLNSVVVQTILVTYDNTAKKNIILVQRIRY